MVIPPRARYKQVADLLRERIGRGEYPPGSRLPGGHELAREFGLHLASIQKAIAILNGEGITRPDSRGRPIVQAWRSYAVTLTAGSSRAERTVEAADPGQALVRVLAEAGPGFSDAEATVKPAD